MTSEYLLQELHKLPNGSIRWPDKIANKAAFCIVYDILYNLSSQDSKLIDKQRFRFKVIKPLSKIILTEIWNAEDIETFFYCLALVRLAWISKV